MDFTFRARDNQGKLQKGRIEASSSSDARNRLKTKGWLVIDLKEQKGRSGKNSKRLKISLKQRIVLTEQLAVMMKAGLSIGKCLNSLMEESENQKIKNMLADLSALVEGGTPLSEALETYHRTFGTVYIQMVRAGEQAGSLDKVLMRLSEQLQKDYEIRSKVRGALIYPTVVMTMMIIVIAIIIVFVLPKLGEVFSESGVELPIATRILLAISAFSVKYGLWIIVGGVLGFAALKFILSLPRSALAWDRFKLRIPIYGPFIKKVLMARFSLGFSSLMSAGLPILTIFETLAEMLDNLAYKEELTAIARKVENGHPIAQSLHESPLFPGMVGQLTAIGEQTGAMDEMFGVVASFYEKEVDNLTRNLSSALEPIIMVVLGVGIAFILLSVLQPMYGLVSAT
jgi:type IV pilus assembly protein PilC